MTSSSRRNGDLDEPSSGPGALRRAVSVGRASHVIATVGVDRSLRAAEVRRG
ncbi:MAG: hypothetical protein OJF62_001484 [Pseudolabrys sp.]|nr:hypothetical protein [Pseudolabrys sp.]